MAKRTNAERRIQQQLANLTVKDIREAMRKLLDALTESSLREYLSRPDIATTTTYLAKRQR